MAHIGLLGGTFDPPHLGHLVVAEVVRDALGLDEMRFLVAGDPWMKHHESPAAHRVKMASLAADTLDGLAVDDRETRRPGATYTAETLTVLTTEHPDDDWYFVVGSDAAASLPRWHRAGDVLRLATMVVVDRPGHRLAQGLDAELTRPVRHVDVPSVDVSSTDMRARVAAGRTIRVLVPDPVVDYIHENRLYRHVDV